MGVPQALQAHEPVGCRGQPKHQVAATSLLTRKRTFRIAADLIEPGNQCDKRDGPPGGGRLGEPQQEG